jgi:hypothetical protein
MEHPKIIDGVTGVYDKLDTVTLVFDFIVDMHIFFL